MDRDSEAPRTQVQITRLRNMRVLLEESKELARGLAYHRRAKIEPRLDLALIEIERQIEERRAAQC